MVQKISSGVVHSIPDDLKKALFSSERVFFAWESISPIARNEWICWVLEAKKIETRERRIKRTKEELLQGKKRPCCWSGCIHR